MQVILGNSAWLEKQPRSILESLCLKRGIRFTKLNRERLAQLLISKVRAIDAYRRDNIPGSNQQCQPKAINAKDASAIKKACFRALRWISVSALERLPGVVLRGLCKKSGLVPSALCHNSMVEQLSQWVSSSSFPQLLPFTDKSAAYQPRLEI